MTANNETSQAGSDAMTTPHKSDKGALLLLMAVAVLIIATLWMSREAWWPHSAKTANNADAPVTATATAQREPAAGKPGLADKFSEQRAREASRLAELKAEAERMAEERRLAEEELQEQLAAQAEEAERQRAAAARQLEEERAHQQAVSEKLAQERLAVQKKLERERAQRAAMERKARLESQRLLEAKRAAEQAAAERARAEARLQQIAAESADTDRVGPVSDDAQESASVVSADTELHVVEEDAGDSEFSTNPCSGPSAKFLSTCR